MPDFGNIPVEEKAKVQHEDREGHEEGKNVFVACSQIEQQVRVTGQPERFRVHTKVRRRSASESLLIEGRCFSTASVPADFFSITVFAAFTTCLSHGNSVTSIQERIDCAVLAHLRRVRSIRQEDFNAKTLRRQDATRQSRNPRNPTTDFAGFTDGKGIVTHP
jgi:hypothetical protein